MKKRTLCIVIAALLTCIRSSTVCAHEDMPAHAFLREARPGSSYSPYVGRSFPTRVFWGDTHVHTSYSFDAGALGCRLSPAEAYRFARGDEVVSSSGQRVKLARPLDFLVVADHVDELGAFPRFMRGDAAVLIDPTARRLYEAIRAGGEGAARAGAELVGKFVTRTLPSVLASGPGSSSLRSSWNETIKAAEQANVPGRFAAFIAFEWTASTAPDDARRVVVYRDGGERTGRMEPYAGADGLRGLRAWMASYEQSTGGRLLAIASPSTTDEPADHVTDRHETLCELMDVDDSYGDASWDTSVDDAPNARLAADGCGFVAATGTHTALATADEDNFFGKDPMMEPSDRRTLDAPSPVHGDIAPRGWKQPASGYTGVWASDNTRDALFDAMARREVYATTGSRITVRFFGGWDFEPSDAADHDPALAGYAKGVPMGATLGDAPDGKAPTFLVAAAKDPIGATLDRVQIVKRWAEKSGALERKVYDVAVSGGRAIGADGRCTAPVGDTVDVAAATWTNTIGAAELAAVWRDAAFDPAQRAVYYARVLEIPTPRWPAYDAKRYGVALPSSVAAKTQGRAYTSPIRYVPHEGTSSH